MHNIRKVTEDIVWIGGNDRRLALFENVFPIPEGVSYNSYLLKDEKTVLLDTADSAIAGQFFENLEAALGGRTLDYVVINHMEPDHAALLADVLRRYPKAVLVGNAKTFTIVSGFFGLDKAKRMTVKEGDSLVCGKHTLYFYFAPMVHWPEVMVTYDAFTKTVFSADGFGKFGALDVEEPWDDEARRYYIGIVGKYGKQVDAALKKLSALQIERICPLHGPVLEGDLSHYFGLYSTWANYEPEIDGVMIAYASVYGHTKKAAELLAEELKAAGCKNVLMHDLARDDRSVCVADAFRYSRLVIAGITYNASLFPAVREFIENLTERNYQKRVVGFIENGTWAPVAARLMQEKFGKSNITFAQNTVSVRAALNNQTCEQVKALAVEMAK